MAAAAALAPGTIGFALSRGGRAGAPAARRASAAGAALAFVLALATAALLMIEGPSRASGVWLPLPGGGRLSVGAYVDGLTVVMLLTVTLIGAVVTRYSVRYLDGDPRQASFSRWLSYTLSAVLVLVISSNLAMFFAAWVATSHGLHRLLTHFRDRPAALLAARKKFLISRLGDVFLIGAFTLIAYSFGSLEFAEILTRTDVLASSPLAAFGIAAGLVLGAMTKSAQFPFHTWLPDSMETPTPVSALMHAGIINAGGFLLIRMSPLLVSAPAAMTMLACGGAFTALFGAVVMLGQTDVKRTYAWSTVSQMGFMMLQCGLGAFAAAALHLVGHSFYKGHAFLAAGSAVDPSPVVPRRSAAAAGTSRAAIGLGLLAGTALVGAAAVALGVDPMREPGGLVLAAVLALAIAQLLLTARHVAQSARSALVATALVGGLVAVAYFAGIGLFEHVLGSAIPKAPGSIGPVGAGLSVVLIGGFVLALLLQARLVGGVWSGRLRAAYVHAQSGFYLGALQNRLVQRLWPVSDRDQQPAQ
jgi:NAD(P)H-quinone oxidoreductase subunit 5